MKPYNIYISGVGGQGIIKTSIIIGEAAMNKGLNVVMSEIHGMAQRGGGVSTELKIGDAKSPIIQEGGADLLIAFEPLEALRAIPKISSDTFIVINNSTIMPFNILKSDISYPDVSTIFDELKSVSPNLMVLDAEKIAKNAGNILSLNMVMLGGTLAVPDFPIDKNNVIESMKDNLPEKSLDINLKALNKGFNLLKSN
ncbi:MAG: indolepyruvate ferredoxin oxidoreductase subunit beta [Methanobacterium sp. BRmetb2]|nr:MAG: indolepyruvate ferredoxin oxidoreductase subunit beta [Methanobacterium sp. BRmetb2]